MTQKWNEREQRVDGEFWFYDEIPDEIRDKIVNEWPTPISAGFTVDRVQDGAQKGLFYTHIAVLRDGEDPKCPLNKCGVNVRMESNSTPPDYRYEKAQSPAIPEEKQPAAEKTPITMETIQAQIAELKALVASMKATPAEPKPEAKQEETPVETEVEQEEEPVVQEPPTPPPKTKRAIPSGPAAKKNDGLDEDGRFTIFFGKQPKK